MQKNAIVELVPIDLTGATDLFNCRTYHHAPQKTRTLVLTQQPCSFRRFGRGRVCALSKESQAWQLAGFHRPVSLPSHHRDCRGGQSHQAAARQELFLSALQGFQQDPGFADTNERFVDFLLQTRAVPSPDLLGTAVLSIVNKLQKANRDERSAVVKGPEVSYRAYRRPKVLRFFFENEALLFRLLPLV